MVCILSVGVHNIAIKPEMGNNTVGSTRITYNTRDKIPVDYIYYDLKGKNRFPPQPPNERQIQNMFEKCLREIEATGQQLEIIRDFNAKYKFRFVILHGRKVEEYKEHHELNRLRRTQNFDEGQFRGIEQRRKKDLDEKLLLLQKNETALKMHLGAIDRYISEKNAWSEFIKINGVERLIRILDKAVQANKQGTKTIFQNQIEILKFLKSLCDHNQKDYFSVVATIEDYPIILLRAYHPVNVAVTAYVLLMLQDYSWKVETGSILQTLKQFQKQGGYHSFLQPFAQTIFETNNILMCYYNLRFVNQVLISIIDDDQRAQFQKELHGQKYELLIEDVKTKLQEGHFKVEHCTFQAVSQQIYKYATRAKESKDHKQVLMNRATTNLDALQQHLLVSFVEGFVMGNTPNQSNLAEQDHSDNDDDYITVLLIDGDKRSFNKFVLDTFSEIQHYYKYTIIVDEAEEGGEEVPEVEKFRKYGLSCQEYIKRIKGSCLKNGCEEAMLNCLKSMQYFEKNEWKRLQSFVQEEMRVERQMGDAEAVRKELEEKDRELKLIKKEFYQFKTQVANSSRVEAPRSNISNVSRLDMSVFELDSKPQPENKGNVLQLPKKWEIPASLQQNSTIGLSTLPGCVLPPPPPPPLGLPNFNTDSNSLNVSILPPPTGNSLPIVGTILPLSGLNSFNILPPPPPPPLVGGTGLPSLPELSTVILPPPPPSSSGQLQGFGGLLPPLPPPPSGFGVLPPPPIGGLGLPPPPLIGGRLGLPSLPPLGGLGGGLFPSIPQQKQKEKRKPKVALKACNYKTLTYTQIVKTIWSEIDDSKVSIDETQLQSLFARAIPKEVTKVQSTPELQIPKKKQAVKLLGADRWRNMEIVLTKLKIPEGAITQALTTCSGKFAVSSVLESMKSLIPTEEQQANLTAFDGDLQDLGKPQRFLKELITVPEYANRIKSILFNGIREQLYFDLQKKIQDLTTAFESLKSNYRFHHVLQVSLAVGNYLNGTGLKGGAWGFKLDTLQRLQQVKSHDSKMNAGLYIIKQVWKKYSYPIFSKEEVDMYQFISKMPISQIKVDLAQLKKYVISIERAFNSKVKKNANDRIHEHCEQIMIESKSKYEQLNAAAAKLDKAYEDCGNFYCQDTSKAASDQIGKKLFKSILFIFNTEKIYFELQQRRKKEEARKAVKNEVKFNQPEMKKKNDLPPTINPQSGPKLNVPMQSAVKLPMPATPLKSGINQITAEQRLKELQRTQQQREKKFLEQMMKKRTSKIVAVRQSRAPGGVNVLRRGEPEIDFLKGL